MARTGVDVGGTNTDLVLECGKGVFYHKVPTTLRNRSIGVDESVVTPCTKADIEPAEVEMIVHVMRAFVLPRHPQAEITGGSPDGLLATSRGASWADIDGRHAASREDL